MRTNHVLLAFAFSAIAFNALGQLFTPSGQVISNTGGNNIGIGMNNPAARLNIGSGGTTGLLLLNAFGGATDQLGNPPPLPIPYNTEYGIRLTFQANEQYGLGGYETPKIVFNVNHLGRTQIGDFPIVPGDDFLAVRGSVGIYSNTTEYFRFRFANNNHELFWVSNNNRNFRFRNSNTGKIPLTLSPAGKVGVNTSDFFGNHDLYVNGSTYIKGDSPEVHSLYIEGTTVAEEIFVKVKANWPDYVFTPAHKRMPLMELDSYIGTHKRLPGMPAAEKVAADGIEMGETIRLLTEKVEEITLYLIDLKKENDILKAEIESLKGGR